MPSQACDIPCVVNEEELCGGKTAVSIFLAVARSILSADERVAGQNGEKARGYVKAPKGIYESTALHSVQCMSFRCSFVYYQISNDVMILTWASSK